jgi:hypothetical protein
MAEVRRDEIAPSDWIDDADAARPGPPVLDADGLLRHRGRWVPIPDTQLVVVELLVRNFGRLVGTSELRRAYEEAGGSGTSTSLRSLIHRLGRRVAKVGLQLHVVRSRGLVLDLAATWAM